MKGQKLFPPNRALAVFGRYYSRKWSIDWPVSALGQLVSPSLKRRLTFSMISTNIKNRGSTFFTIISEIQDASDCLGMDGNKLKSALTTRQIRFPPLRKNSDFTFEGGSGVSVLARLSVSSSCEHKSCMRQMM